MTNQTTGIKGINTAWVLLERNNNGRKQKRVSGIDTGTDRKAFNSLIHFQRICSDYSYRDSGLVLFGSEASRSYFIVHSNSGVRGAIYTTYSLSGFIEGCMMQF